MKHISAAFICLVLLTGCASPEAKRRASDASATSAQAPIAAPRIPDFAGTWVGKAKDGTSITYQFQEEGAVIWLVDEPNFKRRAPVGLRAKYRIREGSPTWEIDIYDFEDRAFGSIIFRGIIQPIDDRQFRMEGRPSIEGGRPRAFSKEAIVFSKTDA